MPKRQSRLFGFKFVGFFAFKLCRLQFKLKLPRGFSLRNAYQRYDKLRLIITRRLNLRQPAVNIYDAPVRTQARGVDGKVAPA